MTQKERLREVTRLYSEGKFLEGKAMFKAYEDENARQRKISEQGKATPKLF